MLQPNPDSLPRDHITIDAWLRWSEDVPPGCDRRKAAPLRIVGQLLDLADVDEAVALEVGFGQDHEAEVVAHRVEARIVRVVRGPDGVDVVRLHHPQITVDGADIDRAAAFRIVIVPG